MSFWESGTPPLDAISFHLGAVQVDKDGKARGKLAVARALTAMKGGPIDRVEISRVHPVGWQNIRSASRQQLRHLESRS